MSKQTQLYCENVFPYSIGLSPDSFDNLPKLNWCLIAILPNYTFIVLSDQSMWLEDETSFLMWDSPNLTHNQYISQFHRKSAWPGRKEFYVSCEYTVLLLLLFLRLRPFLPFLVFLSFLSMLSFFSLLSWLSHRQLSGKHFLSSSRRGQAAPLLAACMRM